MQQGSSRTCFDEGFLVSSMLAGWVSWLGFRVDSIVTGIRREIILVIAAEARRINVVALGRPKGSR